MSYILVKDNKIVYPYSINKLRMDNPNTSFPESIDDKFFEDFGLFRVLPTGHEYNYKKTFTEVTPKLIDGVWTQQWEVRDATEQEIEERLSLRWDEVRVTRNRLLTESDWTQLDDAPFDSTKKSLWKKYRQDLRDITKQSDPFNITWPVKPI